MEPYHKYPLLLDILLNFLRRSRCEGSVCDPAAPADAPPRGSLVFLLSIVSTPSAMAVPKADIAGITLTLQTLGSFYFGGECSILVPFQYCQHDVGQLDR